MRLAFLSLMMVGLAGCGSPSAEKPKGSPSPTKPAETPKVIHTTGGNSTQYSLDAKRERQWDVTWKEATLGVEASGASQTSGTAQMTGVSGQLYRDGKAVSTYQGDGGTADRGTQILTLRGNVQVKSLEYDAVLYCDEIRYEGGRSLVRARGHVRIVGKSGDLQTDSELWATPDLKRVGSPDAFTKL
jgi:hypothetical protein